MRALINIALCLAALSAPAATINWTNTSNGNWSVAANWNPNQVPSTNDTAVITNAGSYTVTLNLDPTLAGLVIGGGIGTQTVATAGNVLTLNGEGWVNANGRLLLSGGSISGTNLVTLAGELAWQSGALDTNAAVLVNAAGQVNIASAGNTVKSLHGCLTNYGIVTWKSFGNLAIGGTLHNRAGALFDAQVDDRSITKSGDAAQIINEGEFRKSVSSGTVSCAVPLLNRGTVDNRTGTLTFTGGSVLDSGSTFIGAGVTRFGDGTNVFNGDFYTTNLVLAGATLAGTGRIRGLVVWDYGTINNGAAITIATNGHLLLQSGNNYTRFVYGNLTNAGTVTFANYGHLGIGGTFHNLAGALFDVQTDNRSIYLAAPGGVIINHGVFRRSVSTLPAFCEVPIINRGTVESVTGLLQINNTFSNSSGTISLAGGTLQMAHPLWLVSGFLTGWSTLIADVTNAAIVRPSRTNGVLTIQGDYEQTLGGVTEFELAGNLPGTNQSRLKITGAAILRGIVGVRWSDGFVPGPGTNFPVMTFASRQGEFNGYDHCILLGQGRRLVPVYSATSFNLITVAAPEPEAVPLHVVLDGDALVAWPAEFTGYELYWSTNLAQTNWTRLPGATNHWIEPPPLAWEKFYRLHKP